MSHTGANNVHDLRLIADIAAGYCVGKFMWELVNAILTRNSL